MEQPNFFEVWEQRFQEQVARLLPRKSEREAVSKVRSGKVYLDPDFGELIFRPDHPEGLHLELWLDEKRQKAIIHRAFDRGGGTRILAEFYDQSVKWVYSWDRTPGGIPLKDLPGTESMQQALSSNDRSLWSGHYLSSSETPPRYKPLGLLGTRAKVVFSVRVPIPKKYFRPFWFD